MFDAMSPLTQMVNTVRTDNMCDLEKESLGNTYNTDLVSLD